MKTRSFLFLIGCVIALPCKVFASTPTLNEESATMNPLLAALERWECPEVVSEDDSRIIRHLLRKDPSRVYSSLRVRMALMRRQKAAIQIVPHDASSEIVYVILVDAETRKTAVIKIGGYEGCKVLVAGKHTK